MVHDNDEWRHLNAYVDGELAEDDTNAFEQRLAGDPALRDKLEQLRDLKHRLARMRPAPAAPAHQQPSRPRRGVRTAVAAAAAVIALAVLSTIGAILLQPADVTWLEYARTLHAEQSRQAYLVEERYVTQTVSSGHALAFRPPDLTASRLFLVDIATPGFDDREAISLHYRGLNGCRLTIVAIEAAGDTDELPADVGVDGLIRAWNRGGFGFAVIAEGMDTDRFASVADYAEAVIAVPVVEDQEMRTAMAEIHHASRPCA